MTETPSRNWRDVLAMNRRKTFQVVAVFILIYLSIGFFIDLYVHGAFVENQFQNAALELLKFHTAPIFTFLMAGAAILSLLITYALHDRLMLLGTAYHEVTESSARNFSEKQLYHLVEELKIAAGLNYMPKIYVIDASYMNAFASGYSERSALIAVTDGLIHRLNRDELQAVIAHELSHIRHGDIRLTLTASVLANLMLIAVDLLFYNFLFSRDSRNRENNSALIIVMLLRYFLPIITMLLLLYLSRTREYMADAGSVELMRDNHPLARALVKISQNYEQSAPMTEFTQTPHEDIRRAAYIFDPFKDSEGHTMKSLACLISTHPSLVDRLRALGFKSIDNIF